MNIVMRALVEYVFEALDRASFEVKREPGRPIKIGVKIEPAGEVIDADEPRALPAPRNRKVSE